MKNLYQYKNYKIDYILNRKILISIINKFWMDVVNNSNLLRVIIILELENNKVRSLTNMVFVDKDSINDYIDYVTSLLDFRSENYDFDTVKSIQFKYIEVSSLNKETSYYKKINDLLINEGYYNTQKPLDYTKIEMTDIGGYKFPNNTNYETWGRIIFNFKNLMIIEYKSKEFSYILHVNKSKLNEAVELVLLKNNVKIVNFTDSIISDNHFTRSIKYSIYHYIDNEIVIIEPKKAIFIEKSRTYKKMYNKIITLDIETRKINGYLEPIVISFYDYKNKKSYCLTDFNSSEDMIKKCLSDLLIPKYNNYIVYIHNLSMFDGIFLLAPLTDFIENYEEINIIKRENNLINIEYNKDGVKIQFRDSLLLLPVSLNKLSKTFNKENYKKDIFPYLFSNEVILDYNGNVPDFKYFNNITIEEYNEYCSRYKNNWSLKDESIKYCEQDCIALYHVIINFNKIIYDLFKINIHKYPTLSSLAIGIYRSNFLKKDYNIPVLIGNIYNEIKSGYTGGSTDLYIPKGLNVKGYDVNSLYPTIMATKHMPVGEFKKFKGDIRLTNPDAFGFFNVEVTAPEDIKHPIIQTKVKTKNGYRTISPTGNWNMMIFSEELYNAEKYGYKFKIFSGYLFEKKIIFKDYVDSLYDIKSSVHKSEPLYLISKLLMNSLYGRFGLNIDLPDHYIVNDIEYLKFLAEKLGSKIYNEIPLGNKKTLISISEKLSVFDDPFSKPVCIAISAAITAYARIFMSQFKNRDDFVLLYSDTDSIFIIGDLSAELIGKNLGQFKLEYIFKKLIILAPKVYGGILDDGTELIKVKGLNKDSINEHLNVDILESLLIKNSMIEIPNNKMIRSIRYNTINIREDLYTLMTNENKRKIIYKNNIFCNTESLKIDKDLNILNY